MENLRKFYYRHPSLVARLLAGDRDAVVRAVDDVSFAVRRGEILGVVGESGSGKSTLGRLILRLVDSTGGRVVYRGREVMRFTPKELSAYRREAQIIFQNPYASLNPRKTVRQILSVPLQTRGVGSLREREQEIRRLLDRVGLAARYIDAYPHQFSGGQRQRVGIARALAMHPVFIIADEPVSSLDVSVQAQILNLLQELRRELDLTYLFIAHDLSVVYHISDRVAVMYLGKIVELADSGRLFDNPAHPYTQALLSSIPGLGRSSPRRRIILEGTIPSPVNVPAGCRFQTRCFMKKGPECRSEEPPLREIGGGHWAACHHYPSSGEKSGEE